MVEVGEFDEDVGRDGALTGFISGIGGLRTVEMFSNGGLM